jgi:hypothetical protein
MKLRLTLLGITLLIILSIPLALTRLLWAILTNTTEAWNMLVAFDRVGNTALNGKSTETISSRAYRGTLEHKKPWCILCRVLDYLQPNHCANSAGQ